MEFLLQADSKIQARSLHIGCTNGEQGQKNEEVSRDRHYDMASIHFGPTASPNA